ncbi:MAG: trk system potassium uptake protein TrkH [Candidatus Omnitrophota bacterium]|jgi:trk system potassium uptake protein TrkH
MRFPAIFYLLGRLFCLVSIAMIVPIIGALIYSETSVLHALILTDVIVLSMGASMIIINYKSRDSPIAIREGFLLVTLLWLGISIVGALPYWLTGVFPSFVDAFFESTSGFTTTGASVLMDIEAVPHAILLWRSLTQWIGGMGIIVLAVAILPQLSVGGMQLMRNEMPGPTFEQLKPRIRQTAMSLWKVYVLFSVMLWALLYSAGMPIFDSICHMFSTMSSGGFSVKNASMAAYSPTIQMIITIFMFLAGLNFVLHYHWLKGDFRRLFEDNEFRFYSCFLIIAAGSIFLELIFRLGMPILEAIRVVFFQVISISSSTGYATTDYEQWPYLSKGILFLLMFVGGCSGSTSGGFKAIRVQLFLLKTKSTLIKQIFPKAVTAVKIGKKPVSSDVLDGVSNLFLVSVVIFSGCTLVLLAFNISFVTATSAVVACLSNVGPGFELVGPEQNYAWFPDAIKVLLALCMIVGRLEFFTILVLFLPVAWKR